MMLVPVWVEYIELAIISEMPVPLPECIRIKMIKPMPDKKSSIKKIMAKGDNVSRVLLYILAYEGNIIDMSKRLSKQTPERFPASA